MVWVNNGDDALDHISDYRTILGVCIALPILTTIVVALRGYSRGRLLRALGVDDFVIFFSAVSRPMFIRHDTTKCCQICGIVYAGLCIGQAKWGLGLPIKLRPKVNINEYSVVSFFDSPPICHTQLDRSTSLGDPSTCSAFSASKSPSASPTCASYKTAHTRLTGPSFGLS